MRNRIKEHRKVRFGDLMPHELNPRIHSEAQRAVLPSCTKKSASPARCWLMNCPMAGSS